MIRAFLLCACLGMGACASKVRVPLDPTLQDGEGLPLRDPASVLDAAASSPDPSTRRAAFSALLRALPAGELARWGAQGSYDPDPWVQAGVALALLERSGEDAVLPLLFDIAGRGSADPYARAVVAHGLIDRGLEAELGDLRGAWRDREDWRAAPLALVATRLGEEAARPVLARALREGSVRDEPAFVVRVGLHGWPGLTEELVRQVWAEEDLGLRLDVARALLGDAAGEQAWRAALRSREADEARGALELVLALPEGEARAHWLRQAQRSRNKGVRRIASVLLRGTGVETALASGDAFVRLTLLPEVLAVEDAAVLLQRALADEEPAVRAEAASLATSMRAASLRPALELAASEDRSVVQLAAYGALLALERRGPVGRAP